MNYLGPDFGRSPGFSSFGGMSIQIVDGQKQQRTERDVIGPWVRPRCPNRGGRKGTRRQWKRKNAPHHIMLYREPTDVLVYGNTIVATPHQAEALRRATREAR